MKEPSRWMLYGPYGTTGRLILDEALRRGHRPLLAGRDEARLAALAGATGLQAITLRLDSPEPAAASLKGVAAVLNAAGPFVQTGAPLRKLCLEAGVSYADVSGEIEDFVAAMRCDAEARTKRVAIIPGAGFGVVFGEALAAHVARRLPGATWLKLSIAAVNASTSRGATRSTGAVLAGGGYAVSGGRLVRRPVAFTTWRLAPQDNAGPARRFAAAPRAELVAAHRLTGIEEIVAGVPLSLTGAIVMRIAGRFVGALLSRANAGGKPAADAERADLRSHIWAEAGSGAGERVLSMLETGEGYQLAAAAAVAAVEKLLAGRPIGSLTPAQAFGADFALSLPGTRITDL